MCGIIGITGNQPKLIREATRKIAHRGPDAQNTVCNEHVSLGHTRLSILDLSTNANQPLSYKHYTIIFNGEIYNYNQIKDELKTKHNYTFTTTSDTEVILAAYDCWKEKCLDKFNGMFAFAIYDQKKKQLFLARDRFGIKPLYYSFQHIKHSNKTQAEFCFSSEIQALPIPNSEKEIDREGLAQYFNFRYTIGETTMLKGVKKFLPGHYMKVSLRTKKIQEYKQWYQLKVKEQKITYANAKKQLKIKLQKAIERRMVSDVPVSSFLSGGIDSSIIATHAKQHNPNLHTFSLGFETTNELPFARQVAKQIQSKHFEFTSNPKRLQSHIDTMIAHMDEPICDPGFLPILYLSKEVAKHNKVVLSGDGADEIFAGYDKYKLLKHGLTLRHFPIPLNSPIAQRLRQMRGKKEGNAFHETARLFSDEELTQLQIDQIIPEYKKVSSEPITNAMFYDMKHLMPNDFFMKADKMSSAYGLEQRVPFMDHEVVEFAFSLPSSYKLRLKTEKRILKDTFADILPENITKRRKHGFNVPIDSWFCNELGDELVNLIQNRTHDLYNSSIVPKLIERLKQLPTTKSSYAIANRFSIAQQLWAIFVFEKWYAHTFEAK